MPVVFFACKKKDLDPPGKAILTFPAQNSLCTSGTVLSPSESSVVLTWNASENTDSYDVNITDLLTGASKIISSTTNQATVRLSRNTPYSWSVVSKSTNITTTAQSDTWKFFLAGIGRIYYSPFPATPIFPSFGQQLSSGTINLSWVGSDVDNDIVGYDIYFGTTVIPPLFKTSSTDMFLTNIPVASGNTYYWKIVTKDGQGNKSDSGVYQFTMR